MYFIKYKKIFYLYFAKYTFYLIVLLPFVCITFPEIGSPLVAGRSRKIGMVVGRADAVCISDVVLLSHYNLVAKTENSMDLQSLVKRNRTYMGHVRLLQTLD